MAAAARLPLRLFWEGGHLADPGCTLAGPKQKTDLCLSLEKVIGRHTTNKGPFGPLVLKFKLNGLVRNGRPQTGVLAARLTVRAAYFARIRH